MSQKLYPTFDVPEVINEEAQIDKEYHRSMKWDPEKVTSCAMAPIAFWSAMAVRRL